MNQNQHCPETNLVWAILSTILCCLPLGIVSIVKASSVEKLWYSGRQDEAIKAANDAKKYAMWGAICAAIFIALYILIYVVFIGIILSAS